VASGLRDRFDEQLRRPLSEHLDEYKAALVGKGVTDLQVRVVVPRVRKALEACKVKRWGELQPSRVLAFLHELRTRPKKPLSVQSANFYLTGLKAFLNWLVRDGRAPHNPLAHLKGGNVRTDRRHDRRALTVDELDRLLQAARKGPAVLGMAGPDRAKLYRVAVETGLRRGELASLTRRSFDLEGDRPTVTVAAGYSKHRREDVQPIRPELVAQLQPWLKDKSTDRPLFDIPDKTAVVMRADLEAARETWLKESRTPKERDRRERSCYLTYRDDSGRVADFHALRHTFITNLTRGGAHPKAAQSLARHSTIMLTMDRYSHLSAQEAATALGALPTLSEDRPETGKEVAAKTGSDGRPVVGGNQSVTAQPDGEDGQEAAARLPSGLPAQSALAGLRLASTCTEEGNASKSRGSKNANETGVNRESARGYEHTSKTHRAGLEPATFGSVDQCSIQLS